VESLKKSSVISVVSRPNLICLSTLILLLNACADGGSDFRSAKTVTCEIHRGELVFTQEMLPDWDICNVSNLSSQDRALLDAEKDSFAYSLALKENEKTTYYATLFFETNSGNPANLSLKPIEDLPQTHDYIFGDALARDLEIAVIDALIAAEIFSKVAENSYQSLDPDFGHFRNLSFDGSQYSVLTFPLFHVDKFKKASLKLIDPFNENVDCGYENPNISYSYKVSPLGEVSSKLLNETKGQITEQTLNLSACAKTQHRSFVIKEIARSIGD